MPVDNFNLADEVNQLHQKQQAVLEEIEELKEKVSAELLPHFEAIEKYELLIALEIDALAGKQKIPAEILRFSEA